MLILCAVHCSTYYVSAQYSRICITKFHRIFCRQFTRGGNSSLSGVQINLFRPLLFLLSFLPISLYSRLCSVINPLAGKSTYSKNILREYKVSDKVLPCLGGLGKMLLLPRLYRPASWTFCQTTMHYIIHILCY